jgi:hypothetical protein
MVYGHKTEILMIIHYSSTPSLHYSNSILRLHHQKI